MNETTTKGRPLDRRVAVVTGASRGVGRTIAGALGEAGATVYVTGRSTRAGGRTEGLPGTIEDAADDVTARGGRSIAVRIDHTRDDEVRALFERVGSEKGRLDLLVNNAWGGYERYEEAPFAGPFWGQPLFRWDAMFTAGVRATAVSSYFAAPLMVEQGSGLIVNTVAWAFGDYLGNMFYDTAKAAVLRMTFGMAKDLEPFGCAAVAITPGFVRTERVMAAHAANPFPLDGTETPEYLARLVVALACDPNVGARSGQVVTVGDLAREYGFADVDGAQPLPFRMPGDG